jgi:hypothetical protein
MRKPEEKYHFLGPRHKLDGNIKIDIQEVGCDSVDWIHVA